MGGEWEDGGPQARLRMDGTRHDKDTETDQKDLKSGRVRTGECQEGTKVGARA